jgi:hypothetical protein
MSDSMHRSLDNALRRARAIGPLPDPRRPGKAVVLVECWCGRDYTLTGPEAARHAAKGTAPCPNPECGRGAE